MNRYAMATLSIISATLVFFGGLLGAAFHLAETATPGPIAVGDWIAGLSIGLTGTVLAAAIVVAGVLLIPYAPERDTGTGSPGRQSGHRDSR